MSAFNDKHLLIVMYIATDFNLETHKVCVLSLHILSQENFSNFTIGDQMSVSLLLLEQQKLIPAPAQSIQEEINL